MRNFNLINDMRIKMFYDLSKTSKENNDYILEQTLDAYKNLERSGKLQPFAQDIISQEREKRTGVPVGFNAEEYPEYLKKVQNIKKKYTKGTPDYKKFVSDFYQKNKNTGFTPQQLQSSLEQSIQKSMSLDLEKLKAEYQDVDYPQGLPKSQKEFIKQTKEKMSKDMSSDISDLKRDLKPYEPKFEKGSDRILSQKSKNYQDVYNKLESGVYGSYNRMQDTLELMFGYNPLYKERLKELNKSDLEKFWDDWGSWIELGAWLLLDFFSEGIALYFSEVRQVQLIQKVLTKTLGPYKNLEKGKSLAYITRAASSYGVPILAGSAILASEGELTEHSLVMFIFAILPFAHKFWGLTSNIATTMTCEKLIEKFSKVNLKSPSEIRKFLTGLTFNEKIILSKVLLKTPKQTIEALRRFSKETGSKISEVIYKTQKLAKKHTGKLVEKPGFISKGLRLSRKYGLIFSADMAIIDIVKHIANDIGILDNEQKEYLIEKYKQMEEGRGKNNLYYSNLSSAKKVVYFANVGLLLKTNRDKFEEFKKNVLANANPPDDFWKKIIDEAFVKSEIITEEDFNKTPEEGKKNIKNKLMSASKTLGSMIEEDF